MNEVTIQQPMTKKEQLKLAFKATMKEFAKQIYIYIEGRNSGYLSVDDIVNDCAILLLKEVSIRTPLK